MHRTTIPLENLVARELRRLAASERRSFRELVNDLLKRGLEAYRTAKNKRVEFQWHAGDGRLNPGIDIADRSTYLEIISRKVS